jgi:diguanylate cyclase (GGDEF)-like protein
MIHGEFIGRRFPIEAEPVLIGRAVHCDIQLTDASVSRAHCRITPGADGVVAADLESTNGVFVNGQKIASQALHDGDIIAVGRSIFKFLHGDNVEIAYHDEVSRLMTTDTLTGAFNKRHFEKEIKYCHYRFQRYRRPLSLVMMDIDNFKEINDEHGHLAGDRVLAQLGSLILGNLRFGDLFCRIGGEEFALLLPESTLGAAVQIAERLRKQIEKAKFEVGGGLALSVTVSFGAAELAEEMKDPQELLRLADERLYAAKRAGRNRVEPAAQEAG